MSDRSLGVSDRAAEFTLPDQDAKPVSLREFLASGCLVLYIYPKDDTPGCTEDARFFRDEPQELLDAGATVVGVSSDDVAKHRRFAEKRRLPFRLLSDHGGELRRRFGVPKTLGLIDGRVTYLIDGRGIIRHVFNSQLRARRHVEEALGLVRCLQGSASASPGEASNRPGDGFRS